MTTTLPKPATAPPTASARQPEDAVVWGAFALLSLIWGSSYLFIRIGVRQLTPESVVFYRLLVGFIVIAAIVTARRISIRVDRRLVCLLAIQGTINTAVPFLLISFGEVHVPSGLAAVLNGTVPIFTMLGAGLFLADEPLTAVRFGGAMVGFVGVIVLMSRGSFAVNKPAMLLGEILILLSSVSYASGAVFARRMLRGIPSMTIAFWAVLFAVIDSGIATAISGPSWPWNFDGSSLFAVLWLGILGSGFAYVLAYFILTRWGASRMTLVTYAMPAVGLALGSLVLGEAVDWRIFLGFLLILLGIGFVSNRRFANLRRTARAAG